MYLEETGLLMVVDSTRCQVKGLAVSFEITVEPDPLDWTNVLSAFAEWMLTAYAVI